MSCCGQNARFPIISASKPTSSPGAMQCLVPLVLMKVHFSSTNRCPSDIKLSCMCGLIAPMNGMPLRVRVAMVVRVRLPLAVCTSSGSLSSCQSVSISRPTSMVPQMCMNAPPSNIIIGICCSRALIMWLGPASCRDCIISWSIALERSLSASGLCGSCSAGSSSEVVDDGI